MLKAVLWEAVEDHLGVALKKPGSFRYEQMKVADMGLHGCNKGGTAYITSLAIEILRGIFRRISRVKWLQCRCYACINRCKCKHLTSNGEREVQGTSSLLIRKQNRRKRKYENHIKGWLRKGVRRK